MEPAIPPDFVKFCNACGVPQAVFTAQRAKLRFARVCPHAPAWKSIPPGPGALDAAQQAALESFSAGRAQKRALEAGREAEGPPPKRQAPSLPARNAPQHACHAERTAASGDDASSACLASGEGSCRPLGWLPGMLQLPAELRIRGSKLEAVGALAGIDAASAAACFALDPLPGHRVLDACAAPGAKLCLLADLMRRRGVLLGVDVSVPRLHTARALARRQQLLRGGWWQPGFRLVLLAADAAAELPLARAAEALPDADPGPGKERFGVLTGLRDGLCRALRGGMRVVADSAAEALGRPAPVRGGDGTTPQPPLFLPAFDLRGLAPPGSDGGGDKAGAAVGACRRVAGEAPAGAAGATAAQVTAAGSTAGGGPAGECDESGWDRILVDAPCTHDGSLKHLRKHLDAPGGWDALRGETGLTEQGVVEAAALQLRLATTAFDALRPGGQLVYATCSLTDAQNEAVVEALLKSRATASIIPIAGAASWPAVPGRLEHTLRFDPLRGDTSGLFLAKVERAAV